MYILFRYPVGVVVEGVVLASSRNRMRIAARGFGDTIELKRSGSDWITADRERVELEFMMPRTSDTEIELPMSQQHDRVISLTMAN
jgi:hypothetical protein